MKTLVVAVLVVIWAVSCSTPAPTVSQGPPVEEIKVSVPIAPQRSIDLSFERSLLKFIPHGQFPMGFMTVWSLNEAPVFPTRSGDIAVFRSPREKPEVKLEAFAGEGTYFVRVFEYLGSGTGLVSDTLTVYLD